MHNDMPASHCVAKARGCDLTKWPFAEKVEGDEPVNAEKSTRHQEIVINVLFLVVLLFSFADRHPGAWLWSVSLMILWGASIARMHRSRKAAEK